MCITGPELQVDVIKSKLLSNLQIVSGTSGLGMTIDSTTGAVSFDVTPVFASVSHDTISSSTGTDLVLNDGDSAVGITIDNSASGAVCITGPELLVDTVRAKTALLSLKHNDGNGITINAGGEVSIDGNAIANSFRGLTTSTLFSGSGGIGLTMSSTAATLGLGIKIESASGGPLTLHTAASTKGVTFADTTGIATFDEKIVADGIQAAAAPLTLYNSGGSGITVEATGDITIPGGLKATLGALSLKTLSNKGITINDTTGESAFTGNLSSDGGKFIASTGDAKLEAGGIGVLVNNISGNTEIDNALEVDTIKAKTATDLVLNNNTGVGVSVHEPSGGLSFHAVSGATVLPTSVPAGTVIWDTATSKLSVSDGATWIALHL